ncbi:TetR/AcrR family transcriptional regulator [Arthrobacter sp. LAPM80]|uniref:TetR/AcrR family transcriptional regulator n=1 Tax=Arthrobacter sp. LAPM80 TaxID=3141788 RepID=UPI00398B5657
MEAVQDRRAARRQATIEEILAAAVKLMARDGVAGMSFSGVARAVGMKPPSLYEYFPSKMALYDALFAQGAADLTATVRKAGNHPRHGGDPIAALLAGAHAYADWSLMHPVSAQLLNWRPVPGFEPSATAYAPNVAMVADMRALLVLAVERGRLIPAATSDDALLLFTSVTAGVVSQQLANEPNATAGSGRYARLLDPALQMWLARYTPLERAP